MVLYVIGLGLGDEKDITLRGLEAVKSCKVVYLEFYTSMLGIDITKLENFYSVPVVLADRDMVEVGADLILKDAKAENIGFLVVGDPLCATTHTDLILRALKENIPVQVIHNASVMGAVASCGLQLYQFGYTVSIPLFEGDWRPTSFYDRIKYNADGGMHTLCLLDIKMKEPDAEAMMKGKMRMLPPRFMQVSTAIRQILEAEEKHQQGVVSLDTKAVAMARLGQTTQKIVYGSLGELLEVKSLGGPLHCLAVCGKVHPLEQEVLDYFAAKPEDFVAVDLDITAAQSLV